MKPRRVPKSAQKRDANGKKLCLTCDGPLPKRRSSYCCDAHWVMNTPSMIRDEVERRDKGICAGCGCQCRYRWMSRLRNTDGQPTYPKEAVRLLPSWQADHIVPVAEGGGLCGVENMRTLCKTCHRRVTKELRVRLKERKREERIKGPDAAV